ncbi:ribosomal RNA Processing 5 isoform X1 [Rhynchophorus ferrugineus]|uniref:ribosomal RNA Processing 5 isoform X1 n=1 Tax=Rhynchophorus ferrugineus TaxID=354439 RepID=UPI003FCD974D
MAIIEEESFPRGGKIIGKRPAKLVANLFNNAKAPKKKKTRKNDKARKNQQSKTTERIINISSSLSYKNLQSGMVILGCIRSIKNLALEVELPGLCFALIKITDISDPFTKYLNKLLESNDCEANSILNRLFTVGQYLPVKILNFQKKEKGFHVEGSINPREIYSEYNYNSYKKGMLIWCSVNSKTDHGFEIYTGVKNCRAFLPLKNIDDNVDLVVGKPLWCIINKNDVAETASTLRLSSKQKQISNTITDIDNLHMIIPGTKVIFFVEKILSSGIQGKISQMFDGYIGDGYLGEQKLSDFHEGQLLNAYVLYSEHITKITHLTLNELMTEEKLDLNVGDVFKGEVCGHTFNGVFFLFKNKYKGFATNRRLLNTITCNKNSPKAVQSKYTIGSKHQCRILDYNHMLSAFICTPEQNIVKEKNYYAKDLSLGQELMVTIVDIKEEGLVVNSGLINGFVTNMHISDAQYTSNIKKKYKINQKVKAKVLNINEENNRVLFTIKPSIVKSDNMLTKIEQAQIGQSYTGFVVKLSDKGALIAFYGDMKGWLSRKQQIELQDDEGKTWNYFFVGQVVTVFVRKIENNSISLSLTKPEDQFLPKVGQKFYGIIESINDQGITFKMQHNQKCGFVPNSHLSMSLSLCKGIKETFKVGDKITNLLYIGGKNPQIYSRREALHLKHYKVPNLINVEKGDLIRCLYLSQCPEGIYVLPFIVGCKDKILVAKEDKDKALDDIELQPYQVLIAHIINVDKGQKCVRLSIKSTNVLNKEIEGVMNNFTYILNELEYLKNFGKKHKWDMLNYQIGQEVACKVLKYSPKHGCVVSLPNGIKGKVTPHLCSKEIKVNDNINGIVISYDFNELCLDICLNPDKIEKINKVQNGVMKSSVTFSFANKLITKNDYIVALLKNPDANQQLIYLPGMLHENDFSSSKIYYTKKNFKVCICGKLKSNLIGISKRLFITMDKNKIKSKPKNGKQNKIKAVDNNPIEEDSNEKSQENLDVIREIDENMDVQSLSQDEDDNDYEEKEITTSTVVLPDVKSFFNPLKRQITEDSSSEDEDNEPVVARKKKKMTPAERAEQIRLEEKRISQIEKELTNSSKQPESADQFDRLLLTKPNCSEIWIKYISFHMAATELDKARAVAKRALDTINMTFTEEKFNVWIVLLNLENMFGTKESFNKVLEDALKFNDSLKIYLRVIQMFADDGKYEEMEEKVKKVKSKYKQEPNMWLELGQNYYRIGKFKEARQCKDAALRSITDKKTQMNIIVQFAVMEFKFGEEEQACAIFESILTTDPKKINILFTYVDQLVKKGQIEQARQVLERSVLQKLPLRSMHSIFMKFKKFEQEHGTEETLENVKIKAQEYAAKFDK